MQYLGTDTGSFGSHWGEKEHIASVHVPLINGTEAYEIPTSKGNPASHVQDDGNGNM